MKKGQAAMEFYVFMGIFLFVFSFIGYTFFMQSSTQAKRMGHEVGREVSGEWADMINNAAINGNGFYGMFKAPTARILNNHYTVNFLNNSVVINGTSNQGDFLYTHPINIGDLSGPSNISSQDVRCVCIQNQNNTINITVNSTYPCACPV